MLLKYIVMCACDRGGDMPDPWTEEFSGIEHTDREAARKEMMSIGRRTRERNGIFSVWIREVEDE